MSGDERSRHGPWDPPLHLRSVFGLAGADGRHINVDDTESHSIDLDHNRFITTGLGPLFILEGEVSLSDGSTTNPCCSVLTDLSLILSLNTSRYLFIVKV